MGERRRANRYEIYLPLQVCMSSRRPAEFCTGQLRNISRIGVYFLLDLELEPGTAIELTFALPTKSDRQFSVLVRASGQALRASPLDGEITPLYGVAATIDRLDFVRPATQHAA